MTLAHLKEGAAAGADNLLTWGGTDSRDVLGWIMYGPHKTWPLAILRHKDGMPEILDAHLGLFMASMVTVNLRPKAFPADVLDRFPMIIWGPPSGPDREEP